MGGDAHRLAQRLKSLTPRLVARSKRGLNHHFGAAQVGADPAVATTCFKSAFISSTSWAAGAFQFRTRIGPGQHDRNRPARCRRCLPRGRSATGTLTRTHRDTCCSCSTRSSLPGRTADCSDIGRSLWSTIEHPGDEPSWICVPEHRFDLRFAGCSIAATVMPTRRGGLRPVWCPGTSSMLHPARKSLLVSAEGTRIGRIRTRTSAR